MLRRHLGQRTVLEVAIPVLGDYVLAAKAGQITEGLTGKQIADGFNQLASQFIHSDYHPKYTARGLGERGFRDHSNGRYRLRPSLLVDTTIEELDQLKDDLLGSLRSAYEQRQGAINRREEICSAGRADASKLLYARGRAGT